MKSDSKPDTIAKLAEKIEPPKKEEYKVTPSREPYVLDVTIH